MIYAGTCYVHCHDYRGQMYFLRCHAMKSLICFCSTPHAVFVKENWDVFLQDTVRRNSRSEVINYLGHVVSSDTFGTHVSSKAKVCTWFGTMCWVVVVSLQTCFRSCEQVKGKSQHVQIVSFQDLRQKSQKHCVENSRHCVPLCCKSFLWYIIYMIFLRLSESVSLSRISQTAWGLYIVFYCSGDCDYFCIRPASQ